MEELSLNVSPSVWNIIKYVTLSLIITPTFEFLLHRLSQQKARWDILRGRTVALSDTRLGIFSLHSTFWGRSRNRYLLLVIGTFVIAIELLFEFSFSSKLVAKSKTEQVWSQPDHQQRYLISSEEVHFMREPALLPVEAANIEGCVEGEFNMRRKEKTKDEFQQTIMEYSINGMYTVRRPYLSATDNATLYCSADHIEKKASFFVPFATKVVYDDVEEEGFDYFGAFEDKFYNRSIYADVDMKLRFKANLTIDDTKLYMFNGKNSICIGSKSLAVFGTAYLLCGLRAQSAFSLAVGSLHEDDERVSISTIVMEMSGPALGPLVDQAGRQIRFLLSNLFLNLVWHRPASEGASKLRKTTLEQIVQIALIVANEEGVAGIRRVKASREVLDGVQERASVKRLAIIPGALIGGMLLLFISMNVLLAICIAKAQRKTGQHSVRISTQFLRKQLRNDLLGMRAAHNEWQEIGYKLVQDADEQRLQLLPQLPMIDA
ncbi:hypothetical protein BWQ96_04830 [Gracilariopsis chorda]|uniref:Uncharacterized protein n=1 Tax=Gracilariopsis chorda TaxID=448386 RepID=A0A2V3ITH0_9FLOR|nr:hypothetical protein BWQ96_04830 [Gracilariopsis chorda]|eukprot:PXF45415.1 hypothetical protein BWQ96_04830 [Gracilariopsis chorda]